MSNQDKRSENTRKAPLLLTDTEWRVYLAIEKLSERGWAPTYREILSEIGWSQKSRGSLNALLTRLAKKGAIEGSGRSLRIIS
jgi:DNA/RNA-binding domain of Phe-tRNA-synthetase-like protein